MTLRAMLNRSQLDPFMLVILAMVGLAALLPCRGDAATGLGLLGKGLVGLLFFLHGLHLAPAEVWRGLAQWRLQALVLATTFGLFPLIGLAAGVLVPDLLSPPLYLGLLFLCALPSTVQSSIAFTGVAGGNVPAALCAASASNLIGIAVTPVLAAVLLHAQGGVSGGGVGGILMQLLLPFLAGQATRPWLAARFARYKGLTRLVDRGTILLIVYTAVSAGVVGGVWRQLQPGDLAAVLLVDLALLALVLGVTAGAARWLGFSRADEIALTICGSTKSLVSGMPMLTVLLPAATAGLAAVPLILFHQLQLFTCAVLARRYARAGAA